MTIDVHKNITGVILAGGKNSRYEGKTKALLNIDGVSLYEKTKNTLEKIFDKVVLITNNPEKFPADNCEKHKDIVKNIGPLGGIHTALAHNQKKEAIFVVAADMPFLNEEIIRKIVNTYFESNYDVIIPRVNSFIEPLNAIYKTSIFSKLDDYLKTSEQFSIRSFIKNVNVKYIDFNNNFETSTAFTNINTPEEFETIIKKKSE